MINFMFPTFAKAPALVINVVRPAPAPIILALLSPPLAARPIIIEIRNTDGALTTL